ncbi:MAG: hypothetical protein GEU88_14550 [Solirubrobacterales bacterium]|nr:hypothetical protein [Solirubrobacterales bacterium]
MFAITGLEPELQLLAGAVEDALGDAEPAEDFQRALLEAAVALGELVDRGAVCGPRAIRALELRDSAIAGVARILACILPNRQRLEIAFVDLRDGLEAFARAPEGRRSAADVAVDHDPAAAVLAAAPSLASAARVLLAAPEATGTARAELVEDLMIVCSALLGLSWHLRAWASAPS